MGVSSYQVYLFFFFQAEDGIRDIGVTGVQTCALPIFAARAGVDPVAVELFELVTKRHAAGGEKAQASVAELEILQARRQLGDATWMFATAVHDHFLDHDRWRRGVATETLGVNHDHAAD